MGEGANADTGEGAQPTASPEFTVTGTVVETSRSTGSQTWSVEYGRWEIEAQTAAHKHRQEEIRLTHDLLEAAKDNEARRARAERESELRRNQERVAFWVVIGVAAVGLIAGSVTGVFSQDPSTRQWAQGIVTTLMGGVVGGLAGYFTGRSR